jgi:hypothetical protein
MASNSASALRSAASNAASRLSSDMVILRQFIARAVAHRLRWDRTAGRNTDINGVPVLAEGESVGLHGWIEKSNLERPVSDCAALPHELIESLLGHAAVAGGIPVVRHRGTRNISSGIAVFISL